MCGRSASHERTETTMDTKQIAEAFSGHRFTETYDHLADDVRWVVPGHDSIEGKAAVVAACDSSAAEMAELASTEFTRFVSVGGDAAAAVDAIGRYVSPDGSVSVVSSADIYEFDGEGRVTTITSYAVELES
jgi:ketosteroid isomerase-like protein